MVLIKNYSIDNQFISANDYKIINVNVPVISGYGRVMWTVDAINATSDGKNMSYINIYRTNIDANVDTMQVTVRNYAASVAKIKILVRMMYVRNEVYDI